MIYLKLEPTFDNYTEEEQCGGMKNADTMEHLCLQMSMVRECEIKGEAVVLTFMDIIKCFDLTTLADMNYMLALNNADIKALKMFQLLTGRNEIRMQGGTNTVHTRDGLPPLLTIPITV